MTQTPILFLSDSPCLTTGLARITRDLASHVVNDLPQFRVGSLGRAGFGSRKLPWAQYNFAPTEDDQFGMKAIEHAWKDFAGNNAFKGILMTIQDPSRMLWFSRPEMLPAGDLEKFMYSDKFYRWGYMPVDSTGPGDRLTGMCRETLVGYDRLLAYGKFGAGVMGRTLGREVDWLPHGIDMDTFKSRKRTAGRLTLGFGQQDLVIGINMTNQPRKDWGLAALIASDLKPRGFKFWWHTDTLERAWSIPALVEDFGLQHTVKLTFAGKYSDEELSYLYSGCDLTILPSLTEGFGYPIAESLACGIPCIHGNYGGGAELIPEGWRVAPVGWRLDTPYNAVRPVFDSKDWVAKIDEVMADKWHKRPDDCRALVEHLDWKKLWPSSWKKWFTEAA